MAELTLETLRAELDAAIERGLERGLALVHARLNAIQRNGDEIRKEVRRLRSKLQSFEEAQASLATSGYVESLGDDVDPDDRQTQ